MKEEKKETRFNANIILQVIAISIFLMATVLLLIGYQKLETATTLTYKETGTLDYKVCLKENEYFEEECLNKGMNYVANLIDYLNIYFNYNFETDSKVDYDYNYSINGVVTVYEKNNPGNIIFEKKINFVGPTIKTAEKTGEINIAERLEVNYDDYNDLVRQFKTKYNVLADSYLKITLNVNTTVKSNNFAKNVKKNNIMEITIPLTENQINIAMDSNEINYTETIKEISTKDLINYICLIGGIITGIITVLLIIYLLSFIIRGSRNKTPYLRFVDKIKKEYDYIVINAKPTIEEDIYDEIIDVDSFQELLDLTNNTDKKIIWTEKTHKKNQTGVERWIYILNESNEYRKNHNLEPLTHPEEITEQIVSWFTIREDKRLYRYVVKSTDFFK